MKFTIMFLGELSFHAFAMGLTYDFQETNGLWNLFTLRKLVAKKTTEKSTMSTMQLTQTIETKYHFS